MASSISGFDPSSVLSNLQQGNAALRRNFVSTPVSSPLNGTDGSAPSIGAQQNVTRSIPNGAANLLAPDVANSSNQSVTDLNDPSITRASGSGLRTFDQTGGVSSVGRTTAPGQIIDLFA